MGQKLFYICNVIAEYEEDYKALQEHLGSYPVNVLNKVPDDLFFDIPTLVVGWNYVKNKFSNQNIFDKKIATNLYWTYSKSEMEKLFFSEVEDFFADSVKNWLPKEFKLFDPIKNNIDLLTYCQQNLNADKSVFVYFSKGAMYLRNDDTNYIVDLKGMFLVDASFKSVVNKFLESYKCFAFSYDNFAEYVDLNTVGNIVTIENLRWVKYGAETSEKYFNIIPNFEINKYIPFLMSKLNPITLDQEEKVYLNRMCHRDVITCWMSSREIAFSENFDNKNIDFKYRRGYKLAKIKYSNKRTITGRIAAHDNYNPQNLQKDNQERADIITRFEGGSILVYDYTSFETRISLYYCDNQDYIKKYADSDLHYETAVILYGKKDISEEERDLAKIFNHSLLYGAGEETLLNKLSIFKDPENKLYQVKQFLSPLIKKANEIKNIYNNDGYLVNEWGSVVRTEKAHASFNNYIQSSASEIVVDKVFEIRELLKGKQSQFLFQVHDSLVFDIHPSEKSLIKDIGNVLSKHKNMNFTLAYKVGENYKNLSQNIAFSS
jgi:hypothetical protein